MTADQGASTPSGLWNDLSRWEQAHHFRATLDAHDRIVSNPEVMAMIRRKVAELEARHAG